MSIPTPPPPFNQNQLNAILTTVEKSLATDLQSHSSHDLRNLQISIEILLNCHSSLTPIQIEGLQSFHHQIACLTAETDPKAEP